MLLFFSLSLLAGCHPEALHPTTLRGELEQLKIPTLYTVEQTGYDTGFAGTQGTGAYNETAVYNVSAEKALHAPSEHMELLTASMIRDELWNYADTAEPSPAVADFGCYEHEQWGVKRVEACFIRNHLTRYERLESKGNHQEAMIAWKMTWKRGT